MAKSKVLSVYDNMDFPPYVANEYPKIVTAPNGVRVKVENKAQEEDVIGTAVKVDSPEVLALKAEIAAMKQKLGEQLLDAEKVVAEVTAAQASPIVENVAATAATAPTAAPKK